MQQIKEAGPEEKHDLAVMVAEILDLSTQLLRDSQEFRGAFARVHTEFFKFPESGETINQAFIAHKEFASETGFAGDRMTTH